MDKLSRSDIEDLNFALMYKSSKNRLGYRDYPIAIFMNETEASLFMKSLGMPNDYYIMEWHEMEMFE